jgi:hypothetical protein
MTGLPGVSMRFGTSHDGMPIGVQIVGSWQAESTILHVASLLEQVSPVRDLHPNLYAAPVIWEQNRSGRAALVCSLPERTSTCRKGRVQSRALPDSDRESKVRRRGMERLMFPTLLDNPKSPSSRSLLLRTPR